MTQLTTTQLARVEALVASRDILLGSNKGTFAGALIGDASTGGRSLIGHSEEAITMANYIITGDPDLHVGEADEEDSPKDGFELEESLPEERDESWLED